MKLRVYSDGGSRGNPGPAAYAYVIVEGAKIVFKSAKRLGVTTNNVAEYNGLINALKKAKGMKAGVVECFSDSELMIKQLRGEYLVKAEKLLPLFVEVKKIISSFDKVSFTHVPRTNKYVVIADSLLNEKLDE